MTMAQLPAFQTIDEAAAWAETHDTAQYFDDMEDAPSFEAERQRRPQTRLNLYLSRDAIAKLRMLAGERQLDYHTLAEVFIMDRLTQETSFERRAGVHPSNAQS
jgi:hypothetical protein